MLLAMCWRLKDYCLFTKVGGTEGVNRGMEGCRTGLVSPAPGVAAYLETAHEIDRCPAFDTVLL